MAEFVDSLLKIANSPVLQQFLHDCVDDLIGTKQANFDNYNSDIEWTIDDFNNAKTGIQKLYRQSVITNCDLKTNLGDNVQQEIKNCFEIRKDDIFQALIKEKLVKSGHNLVENLDWKLKWVLGSSKLASIRQPLLQVDLHCLKKSPDVNNISKHNVNFEVNLETLDLLIAQLQKAKSEIKTENE
ncbi:HCaRG domain containing protein [Asbolus verrucosus]|uniref:HCaRG domain containing protein n=1 Tax=Asbolus verrucosus TaxID=1661398 RepID=A0A482W2J7_ASBVE|nr:HCaRG domain containing protein [Asbolus verrucosus]